MGSNYEKNGAQKSRVTLSLSGTLPSLTFEGEDVLRGLVTLVPIYRLLPPFVIGQQPSLF